MPGTHHCGTVLHRALPEPHAETANALPAGHVALADTAEQDTIELLAGDAVALDYRLLHGTHANETARRRDCIILSFAPNWNALPREIKAHLIMHPALPDRRESEVREATCYDDILPRFDGTPESQRINRIPPANFAISDS
jgi:ectoine hydroxylase-related dioxygenase (phytanoyl-CoA dioxygenase family)